MAVTVGETLTRLRADEAARREQNESVRRERIARLPEVARLLREAGAGRIAVFGSLPSARHFTEASDVELAVWGLRPEALIAVRLDPETVPASLRERIAGEGRPL